MKLIVPIKEIPEEAASLKKKYIYYSKCLKYFPKISRGKNFTPQNLNIWAIAP